jgi:hypothetical protein
MNEDRNIALVFGWRPDTVQRDTDGTVRVSWFKVSAKTCVLYPGRCYRAVRKLKPMSKALEEEYRADKKSAK